MQSELSRLQQTASEQQEMSQRLQQEMDRKLQEKEQTIRAQREKVTVAHCAFGTFSRSTATPAEEAEGRQRRKSIAEPAVVQDFLYLPEETR